MKLISLPEYNFNDNDKIAVGKVKDLSNKWGFDYGKWEYYSSLLYIHEDMYFRNWDVENVKFKIAKLKPIFFDRFKFDNPLLELKELGLLKRG